MSGVSKGMWHEGSFVSAKMADEASLKRKHLS